MTNSKFFEACWWIGAFAMLVAFYCYGVLYNAIALVED
jgi:hypothetical protein